MKFKTSLSAFNAGLQKVIPALPRKSTLPVLEHLHFSLQNDVLQIMATDQDITIQTKINVEGEIGGAVLIPGRRLIEIIKALGTLGNLELSVNEDNYEITIVTQNPVGSYTLKGLSHTEFLRIPELIESAKPKVEDDGTLNYSDNMKAAFFTKEEIRYLSSKTVYAVSGDEFRPAMNGVLFQFRKDYAVAVATDSFRLARVILRKDIPSYPVELDVLMPGRAVEVLKKTDSDLIMSFIESRGKRTHARFDMGDTVFINRLIDENFPPYESVIPLGFETTILLNQVDALAAVNRVSIMTSELSHQVRIHLDNNSFTITGSDEETGSHAVESLHCDYEGDHLELAFNSKYLKEALENLTGESEDNIIEIKLNEATRPVIMKPHTESDNLMMLIMPVRFK